MKRTKQSTFAKRERQEKATGFAPVGSEDMSKSEGAQFTPGPWVINANGDINSEQGAICWLPSGIHNKHNNATLIAAAPAMYEALKTLHGVLDQRMSDGRTLNQHLGKELFECFYGPAIAARAAIAKAEGV